MFQDLRTMPKGWRAYFVLSVTALFVIALVTR